jgi:hypothetical protein
MNQASERLDLWPWLLFGVGLLLFAELWFTRRLG